jgi:hypothetical protein
LRLKSAIWVAAFLRRCAVAGSIAVLRKRGAEDAGAILIKVDRLDGTADLYGPAPPSLDQDRGDRIFAPLMQQQPAADVEARIARERRFDPDLCVVEVEDRQGRVFLEPHEIADSA